MSNFGHSETGCFWRKTNELLDWFSFGLPNHFCFICIFNNLFPNTSFWELL